MIQALNSANTKYASPLRKQSANQSFGHKHNYMCDENGCYAKPKSKARLVAGALVREFITGALVSAAIDGLGNAWAAVRKNPDAMVKLPQIAKRAGFWGVAWIAMGAVIGLVSNAMRPRN